MIFCTDNMHRVGVCRIGIRTASVIALKSIL
jgi:hypothetical protein